MLYVHVKLIGNYSFRVETHKILRHQHTHRTQACRQSHMQTHEVCKNDNIIIFRRETQKHFFIRAVAKHKKGRNSRNNFFKNIVMVRKKKTLLSTFEIVSLNHDKCYFEYLIDYFVILIHTFNKIQSSINISMILLKKSWLDYTTYLPSITMILL